MIRNKIWYRYGLITYIIENYKKPEDNIATVQKYMDFIYDKPTKEKVIKITKQRTNTEQVLPKQAKRWCGLFIT
jgi:hypothetical protein